MQPALRQRIQALTQKEISHYRPALGGYTPAERWVVTFTDQSSGFAKLATTSLTARWLRAEHHWYSRLQGDFLPRLLAFEDHPEAPLLLLEDLSSGHWPPPWEGDALSRTLETLQRIAKTRPLPEELSSIEESRGFLSGWTSIAQNPAPFLSLKMCSKEWLEQALPVLLAAQEKAPLSGEDLLHFDVRSDNICILPDRVVLVDWNAPAKGNGLFDLACFAPSLRLEGGPLPDELVPNAGPFAALISGYFAANAGLPPIPNAPRVRWIQKRQLRIALPWAIRALGLPPLDLRWSQSECDKVYEALQNKQIDESTWHQQIEEALIDAYLSTDDPRAQSGKSGDEDEWRWSREIVLDALVGLQTDPSKEVSILDIGCANGYLLESLHRWSLERGTPIEPYGLEISARMASLARRRLPHFAGRIWTGNAWDWTPSKRFSLVHTGLDYVPPHRQKAMIERILREFLLPGGRLVIRPERVVLGQPDVAERVRSLGVSIDGILERAHPQTKTLRRTVWLGATVERA